MNDTLRRGHRHVITIAAGFGVFLAGCAGTPVTAGLSPEAKVRSACEQVWADRSLDPIREKIHLPLSFDAPQSVAVMANRDVPTDAERPAILAVARAMEQCQQDAQRILGPLPAYRLRSIDRVNDALALLHAGELTYGRFARDLLYVAAADKAAREQLDEEIRTRERWRSLHDYDGY